MTTYYYTWHEITPVPAIVQRGYVVRGLAHPAPRYVCTCGLSFRWHDDALDHGFHAWVQSQPDALPAL